MFKTLLLTLVEIWSEIGENEPKNLFLNRFYLLQWRSRDVITLPSRRDILKFWPRQVSSNFASAKRAVSNLSAQPSYINLAQNCIFSASGSVSLLGFRILPRILRWLSTARKKAEQHSFVGFESFYVDRASITATQMSPCVSACVIWKEFIDMPMIPYQQLKGIDESLWGPMHLTVFVILQRRHPWFDHWHEMPDRVAIIQLI